MIVSIGNAMVDALQESEEDIIEKLGLNISSVKERKDEFDDYCLERNISVCFLESDYKKNMDLCCNNFINNLVARYPGKRIDSNRGPSKSAFKTKVSNISLRRHLKCMDPNGFCEIHSFRGPFRIILAKSA